MGRKIGLMGGTFDPIHVGHLILAEAAYEQCKLDKVYFMPAGNPPHKRDRRGRASNEQRIDMVRKAIACNDHFELSTVEMEMTGLTYTFRTLECILTQNPNDELYFIIGGDSLFDFETWKYPEKICKMCNLVVAARNHTSSYELDMQINHLSQKFDGTFLKLDMPDIDISSNMLRERVRERKSIRYYVPDSVADYIRQNNMYEDCM